MDEIWTALLTAFFASFLGALFAILGNLAEQNRQRHQRQRRVINGLIAELHQRRAFAPDQPIRVDSGEPRTASDLEYATRSVIFCRDEARIARGEVDDAAFNAVVAMIAILNRCIESMQQDPDGYRFALQGARKALDAVVSDLAATNRRIIARAVGAQAFDPAE